MDNTDSKERRMASSQKKQIPPDSVSIPKALSTVSEIFSIDCEKTAKSLLEKATMAIYGEKEDNFDYDMLSSPRPIKQEELDSVYTLIRSIKPQDAFETLAASQIVVCHILGMRKLAQSNSNDLNLGLKLLRLSNDAMERLERKRTGGRQNICVTYNNSAPSMQAIIAPQNKDKINGL